MASDPDPYERFARKYTHTREAEPAISEAIRMALGDARFVINVGAGAGSYEPRDRCVVAVEPSRLMAAQRPARAAPVVVAFAEDLPFGDKCADASLAVQTLHHWRDLRSGLAEVRRVTRDRFVIFMYDPTDAPPFWLFDDYIPAVRPLDLRSVRATLAAELGVLTAHEVSLPHGCRDGFLTAYWGRPEAYLDENVRANMSAFVLADNAEVAPGLKRLEAELASGEWDAKYGDLRNRRAAYLGHRVLIAEFGGKA